MALTSTIHKAELHVSNIDTHYYQTHSLTIAQHPSETTQRMMLRLVCFALNASDALTFTKGLSATDEPDLWEKDLTGKITCWIELGQPDIKRLKKGHNQSDRVRVYCYGGHADPWWEQNKESIQSSFPQCEVFKVEDETLLELETLCQRNMTLNCNIHEGDIWFGSDENTLQIPLERRK